MPRISLDGQRILVELPYEERERAKVVSGYRWAKEKSAWAYPLSYFTGVRLLKNFQGADIQPEFLHWIKERHAEEQTLKEIRDGKHIETAPAYLKTHQKICFEIAKRAPRFAFYLKQRMGKTPLSIEIIRHYGGKWLVVCPLSIIESAWAEDVARFGNGLKMVSLWAKSKQERIAKLQLTADVFVVNYDGFKMLLPEIQEMEWQGFILDEASKAQDTKSQITKAVFQFSEQTPNVYLLTGTPATNNELEFWPHMRIVDPSIFGSKTGTMNRFFQSVGFGGFKKVLRPELRDQYMSLIKQRAIFFGYEDVVETDRPAEPVYEYRHTHMTPEQEALYKKIFRDCVAEVKNGTIEAVNILAKTQKLRQVSVGFAYMEDGSPHWVTEKKFDDAEEYFKELGDEQVIVLCQFEQEFAVWKRRLGEDAVYIYGDTEKDDKDAGIKRFKAGAARFLIGHPRSMAHGLDLANCNHVCWFSMSWSYEEFSQACARASKMGKKTPTIVTSLLCRDSVEEKIYKAIRQKRAVNDALMEMLNV